MYCKYNNLLSCTGTIRAGKLHWLDTFLLYTVTDQNIAFLVPDLCWTTERNDNSTSQMMHLITFRPTLVSAIFRQLAVVFDVFILQDKHNIRTLSLNI